MSEKYLKWLMLREIIGEYLSNFSSEEVDSMKLFFCGKEYNVERLRADYIRLAKELLKDYEIPAPKQDESGKGSIWDNTFDGTATLL